MLVDFADPVVADIQAKLELINDVNGGFQVTYCRYSWFEDAFKEIRSLRPQHWAKFTDNLESHGRLYGDHFSHQGLRKVERSTIRFGGEESIELDFSCTGPRMLYHLQGQDYAGDIYALWDDTPTEDQRFVVKKTVNIAINAKSKQSASGAFRYAMQEKTREGEWKIGRALEDARKLSDAIRQTGLGFREVYELIGQVHPLIVPYLGSDIGLRLMRRESRIALNVLYHFAQQGIPCLGIHDGFIVPVRYEDELRRTMNYYYQMEMGGFLPVIKPDEQTSRIP
jgi:hypothetical protein